MRGGVLRQQYPINKFSSYMESNSINNQPLYQIVPIINHKNHSMHSSNNYQYNTPSPSPIKLRSTPYNLQSTPNHIQSISSRNTPTMPIRNQNNQVFCKTAEKRNDEIFKDNEKNINEVLMEKNKQMFLKERELSQQADYLARKIELLLKENISLNSIAKDLGKDLLETKQKLKMFEKGNNSKNNDELEFKIQSLNNENEKLIKMIDIQNREENSLKFMEEKIDCVLAENNKLNALLKKEKEISFDYKRKLTENGKQNNHNNLEYENKILEYKMQELQKKLEVIFEDNDKLESILKAHEEEYNDLKVKYEKEVEKNAYQTNQINELLIKMKDLKNVLKSQKAEKLEESNNNEDFENLIEKNNKLQKENGDLERKIIILIEQNNKLNECFVEMMDDGTNNLQKIDRENDTKIEILLSENGKLQSSLENIFKEHEKIHEIYEENKILKGLAKEKENWQNKYLELEKKIKNLF